jgi:L-fuconolactonase
MGWANQGRYLKPMLKIDSHQHFWIYHPVKDAWINSDMQVIRGDFLPDDVLPLLQENKIAGCVAVQADQSETETNFLLSLAKKNSFIKGVVGWVDLSAGNIEERLQHYSSYNILKGFRHILQAEADISFMLNEKFMHGISLLHHYNFTYDFLINTKHLPYAKELIAAFPNQRFVIDHIAKPFIKEGLIEEWEQGVRDIAAHYNIYCKVSGMVTEADWANCAADDFIPYLDVVFNAFGPNRVMFGSDWPVCNLAGGYKKAYDAVSNYVDRFNDEEQALFWAGNAIAFYRLEA